MSKGFDRALLPDPYEYYSGELQGMKLRHLRASARCPFHNENTPSFSVNLETGAYNCFSCGVRGKDVLDFHRARYCMGFAEAAKRLGAWR